MVVLVVLAVSLKLVTTSEAQRSALADSDSKTGTKKLPTPGKMPNFDIRYSGQQNIEAFISRTASRPSLAKIGNFAVLQKESFKRSLNALKKDRANVSVQISPLTGTVEMLRDVKDGLSKENSYLSGVDIVKNFLTERRDLFGLTGQADEINFLGDSHPDNGLRMVRAEQMVNGRPIFQSETRFIIDSRGRIISTLGLMIPNASESLVSTPDIMPAHNALKVTLDSLKIPSDVEKITVADVSEDGWRQELTVADSTVTGRVTSKLVYFPVAPGVLVPAWSQIIFGADADWYIVTDAENGTVLWKKNIRSDVSTHNARFNVFVQADGTTPADSPAPRSPSTAVVGAGTQYPGVASTIVSMLTAQNITASPNGWIDDCPVGGCTSTSTGGSAANQTTIVSQTQTVGNNVLACLDVTAGTSNVCDTAGASALDGGGMPIGNADANGRNRDFLGTTTRDFTFTPPPQSGNPESGLSPTTASFRRGSVVQQFYVANWYHDKLYALGFGAASGNFQNNNFSSGGAGNDRVLLDVQDGGSTNNANFATPPDGTSGRAQMYIFPGPTVDRDGGIDSEILMHELTHGTSNRLIGNGSGLQWDVGAGMGEGWSDFFALSLLNNTNDDDPNGNYASGAYATYKLGSASYVDNYVYGIRRFPYSTNNSINPLTWADVDQTTYDQSGGIAGSILGFQYNGAMEVHNVGEIWANTLWEMRSRIIAANGNDVPTGNQKSLQLVLNALKMTPLNPTFPQARDAIIDADCATNSCAYESLIWAAFADRGLGYSEHAPLSVQFGLTSSHIGLMESTQTPDLHINSVTIDDSASPGNNNSHIDPNETVDLKIDLVNPWRGSTKTATGVTATLTEDGSTGMLVINGTSAYPNIAPSVISLGNSAFTIKAPASACGSSLKFKLDITSSLGTVSLYFTLWLGTPSGTLAPITYTATPNVALSSGYGDGKISTITVNDDYMIADVDVRINSITNTNDGDVSFGIRGPSGTHGPNGKYEPTGFGTDLVVFAGFNSTGYAGHNFTNTVLDDEATGDLLSATSAQAPFTGSYKPVFNLPDWTDPNFYGANPDAVPSLSHFDGTSVKGDWKAVASDQGYIDSTGGTFGGWSLIVTPQDFSCSVQPPASSITVAGRITRADGNGIANVKVTLIGSGGIVQTAITNPFGYFTFLNVSTGQSYTAAASAKQYSFETKTFDAVDNIADLNFTAQN